MKITQRQPEPIPKLGVVVELSGEEATKLANELTDIHFDNVSSPTVHHLWKTLRFDLGYGSLR